MKQLLTLCLCLCTIASASAQVDYGTPPQEAIPAKLKNIRIAIDVLHFPKKTDAIKIKDLYYWKHITSILCTESEVTITEFGAYIFYNDQWNLRQTYPIQDLDDVFDTKQQRMLQAQPYTWTNNYRSGDTLFAGWALWYFIGETPSGESICGYETIYTSDVLLN